MFRRCRRQRDATPSSTRQGADTLPGSLRSQPGEAIGASLQVQTSTSIFWAARIDNNHHCYGTPNVDARATAAPTPLKDLFTLRT